MVWWKYARSKRPKFHKYHVSRNIIIMSSHCTWVSTISLPCLQWLQWAVCSQLKPCDNAIWLASCSGTTRILGKVCRLAPVLGKGRFTKPCWPSRKSQNQATQKKLTQNAPSAASGKSRGSKPTFRVTAMLWWTWISDQRCRSANL